MVEGIGSHLGVCMRSEDDSGELAVSFTLALELRPSALLAPFTILVDCSLGSMCLQLPSDLCPVLFSLPSFPPLPQLRPLTSAFGHRQLPVPLTFAL